MCQVQLKLGTRRSKESTPVEGKSKLQLGRFWKILKIGKSFGKKLEFWKFWKSQSFYELK